MSEVFSLGVDMGGTKIEAAVVRRKAVGSKVKHPAEAFEVLARQRVPTERERGYEAILESTLGLIHAVAREGGVDPTQTFVGVGMPGSVSRQTGLVKNSNTVCLNGRPFRQDLSRKLGRSVTFENDANCFAAAEARFGAAREYLNGVVFGVIMGTGVGGGVVLRGRVWGGLQGLAGEWGHHAVGPWRRPERYDDPPSQGTGLSERPVCSCGKMGCMELYGSGRGAEEEYRRRTGKARSLAEIASERARDPDAARVVDELLEAFGRGLSNVIDILDPSAIVLGGGVSNLPLLYTEGVERVRKYVCNDELVTPIMQHELGDSAGVLGAALLDEMGESGA